MRTRQPAMRHSRRGICRWVSFALVTVLVAGCNVIEPPAAPTPAPPQPTPTPEPARPEDVASAYFQAWQQGQYGLMYELLSPDAQLTTSREVFIRRYTNIHD